jgi:acetyltransferase-like isoleucine patch superfamily enzyme
MNTPAYDKLLSEISELCDRLDTSALIEILKLLKAPVYSREELEGILLWNDYLPMIEETPYSQQQRYLHFLWETIDKLPLCSSIPFSVPFRKIVAERLFKSCGRNFIAEEGNRFNFGCNIEAGRDVIFNRGNYFDTKGGISFGDFSAVAEFVKIYSHTHSESNHEIRSYNKVRIGRYAKIYSGAVIFPGVTIGDQAIVAALAVVSHDVPPNTVVAGSPAKVIRERRTEGNTEEALNHYWLHKRAFQTD